MTKVQGLRLDLVDALVGCRDNDAIGLGSVLAEELDTGGGELKDKPMHLYQVYHHHDDGGCLYLVWADDRPSQKEIVEQVLQSKFEPDKDEWIEIDAYWTYSTH